MDMLGSQTFLCFGRHSMIVDITICLILAYFVLLPKAVKESVQVESNPRPFSEWYDTQPTEDTG